MKVSVIIPSFNVENYIQECLDSVLKQDHKDIEIICVDDCSSDGTYSILQSYKQKHPSIILLKNDANKGAPYSRNRGLTQATGEYIQFLDADDLLMPGKISHQAELILNAKIKPDFIAGLSYWEESNGKRMTQVFTYNNWEDLILYSLGDTCSNLWNSQSLKNVGGWTEGLKSSQETDLLYKFLVKDAIVLYDPLPLTIVQKRKAGSISTADEKGNLERTLNIRIKAVEHLRSKNNLTAEIAASAYGQLFIGARLLYKHNREKAIEIVSKVLPAGYLYSGKNNVDFIYKFAYYFFGFDTTEKCILNLKRFV